MSDLLKISFAAPVAPRGGVVVVFVDADLKLAPATAITF